MEPTPVVDSTSVTEPAPVEPEPVPEETMKLCKVIIEKLQNVNSKVEEYNNVKNFLIDYSNKGFNVNASIEDLEKQKQHIQSLETKVNQKLSEIIDLFA